MFKLLVEGIDYFINDQYKEQILAFFEFIFIDRLKLINEEQYFQKLSLRYSKSFNHNKENHEHVMQQFSSNFAA